MSARLHLENPMTVQRGYAFRGSTASACQGERYAADKAGAGTDLDRAAHPYQRSSRMRGVLLYQSILFDAQWHVGPDVLFLLMKNTEELRHGKEWFSNGKSLYRGSGEMQ